MFSFSIIAGGSQRNIPLRSLLQFVHIPNCQRLATVSNVCGERTVTLVLLSGPLLTTFVNWVL